MKVLALTGGIATGKSTVGKMLVNRGAELCSADADARAVLEAGSPTLADVLRAFPEADNYDGTIDRAVLAARIFSDPEARLTLNSIMHPAIRGRMRAVIEEAREEGPGILIYEVPLLYEGGLETWFDGVLVAYASPEAQAERLQERERKAGRPPLTPDEISKRLAAQMPTAEKARRADWVISTDIPMEETERLVDLLWARITAPDNGKSGPNPPRGRRRAAPPQSAAE